MAHSARWFSPPSTFLLLPYLLVTRLSTGLGALLLNLSAGLMLRALLLLLLLHAIHDLLMGRLDLSKLLWLLLLLFWLLLEMSIRVATTRPLLLSRRRLWLVHRGQRWRLRVAMMTMRHLTWEAREKSSDNGCILSICSHICLESSYKADVSDAISFIISPEVPLLKTSTLIRPTDGHTLF